MNKRHLLLAALPMLAAALIPLWPTASQTLASPVRPTAQPSPTLRSVASPAATDTPRLWLIRVTPKPARGTRYFLPMVTR